MLMLSLRVQVRLRFRLLRKVLNQHPPRKSKHKLTRLHYSLLKKMLMKEAFSLRMLTSVLMKLSFRSILKSAVKLCVQQSARTAIPNNHSGKQHFS